MAKKNIPHIYPLGSKTLGASNLYIHSRWLNFEYTIKNNSYVAETERLLNSMKDAYKELLKKEMNFYNAAEKSFFEKVQANALSTQDQELIKISKDRDMLLEYIRKEFKKEKSKKATNLYAIEIAKSKISFYQMQWYDEWSKKTGGKNLTKKQFQRYAKIIPDILDGLEKSVEIISKKNNKNILYRYKGTEGKDLKKDKSGKIISTLTQRIKDITGTNTKKELNALKDILNTKPFTQKEMKKFLKKLVKLMAKIYKSIHIEFGLLAEEYMKEFIENFAEGILVDQDVKVVGQEYAHKNIMDVRMMKVDVKTNKNVEIGFSQKFRNKAEFTVSYPVRDVIQPIKIAKLGKDFTLNAININNRLKYFRRNVVSLNTFSLEKKSIPSHLYKMIDLDKELALMRGLSRFFNQYLSIKEREILKDDDDFLGYNVILSLRQDIYYMKDFIDVAYAAAQNIKGGSLKSNGVTGKAKIKGFKDVNKQRLITLWRRKQKLLKDFQKIDKEITYKDLFEGTADIIKTIGGGNFKLIESVAYTLDPSKLKSKS